ncbi:MAG: multidrug efflux MFS transporter [Clostridiales Family XIII bacterium]|jgi:EmrB/QacA subfamily drug resistance transporter|nr:multidrug efflux MFS transporter [Clostridiales Family XIII bacterium]
MGRKNKDNPTVSKKEFLMVGILIFGGFITVLNQMVMSPALPSIMATFGVDAAQGQWLTSIFLLVNGLMVPITAWLIGNFTSRQLFFAALGVFTVGTVICALAGSFAVLLGGRVLQAVGAGIMLPFVSVMIMRIFPKERRGFALGVVGVVMGVAPAAGPTLGGWLTDAFGWQYIFFAMLPLAVAAIVLAAVLLRNLGDRSPTKLDWLSVLLSTAGFGGLLYGFSSAGSAGWLAPQTLVSILGGAGIVVLFVVRQVRRDEPMLNFRVFKNKSFTAGMTVTTIIASGMTVGGVITPIFLQNVLGYSAMQTGLIIMPAAIIMAGISPVSGMLFDRFGPRALCITGCAVIAAGSGMLALVGPETTGLYICLAYSFRMGGIALVNMPANTWGLNALKDESIAHGNAIINTSRQVFGSIGTAVLVTVMTLVSGIFAPSGELVAVSRGIDAAYAGAALITVAALALSIAKVGRKA